MLRVGLTGGIGSGKSTVAVILREFGVPVFEADDAAREIVRPGESAYREIVQAFGNEMLRENGEIDRARLAAAAFASSEKLDRLNRIVHPRVIERAERWLADREREGATVAVVEAPLLVEAGYHQKFDRLAVVWCRPEQQLARLLGRGMSAQDAERRIAAQMPVDEKKRRADDVIDNSGTPEATRRHVERLMAKWKQAARESKRPVKNG